jgi:polyisoprenyl-phosphate glycosyltransferase
MTSARRLVAYVLPVYNEAAGIGAFHDALIAATDARPDLDFEFVYVDDGSRDASLDRLVELRAADDRVTVIALARNFGHQIAVTAGLDAAAGRDAVVVMDTDLQDPPAVSLELIATWEAGADVAYAQRRTRQDSAFKRGTAFAFYWLLTRLASIDIPRNVGDFRLMDRRVVAEVIRYREHDRFLRGIVSQVGFRQGLLISFVSLIGALFVIYVRVFEPAKAVPGWAFIAVGMFLLSGLQLLMMGVIGSYLGRVYVETQDRPLYALAMVARGRDEDSP